MPDRSADAGNPNAHPIPVRRRDWTSAAGAVILSAVVVAVYGRTFSVPFLFDDAGSITGNPTIRHFGTALWPPAATSVSGRPVLNLTLAANYAVSGSEVWSYHALNLAIHVLASLALLGLLRRALSRLEVPRAPAIAFCAALIWAVHPLLTESVTYTIQRAESLMGLFYLLTLYGLVRGAGADGPGARLWYALCVGACCLGMGTKEVMVTAPLVALLYDRTFLAGSFGEALRQRRWVYASLAATWLALALLVLSTHGRSGTAGFASGIPWWRYGLAQLPALVHYLRLALWPHGLVFDYGSALAAPSMRIAPSALAIAALAALSLWAAARRPALGFLGMSFFAILAPSSSIVPVATETIAEHRMYLPLIPVVVLVVLGIHRWMGRFALPLCLVLSAGLLGATWRRNGVYRSEAAIWNDAVTSFPTNARAHNNLGYILYQETGNLEKAIGQYREALRLDPSYAQAHYNLACALVAKPGRLNEAIAHFNEALRLEPGLTEAHYNLGCALETIPGRLDEAIGHYKEALRQNPGYVQAHYNLGCVLLKLPGRADEAVAHFEEAIRLAPGFAEAHYNLGRVLETQAGRQNDAITQYEDAIRLNPGFAKAHHSLGGALQTLPGRLPDAIAQYEEALRLDPNLVQAHFSLAFALEGVPGRMDDAVAQYREALRLRPEFAEAHFNLGCILQKLPGRTEEAILHFEEALRLRPDYAEAHCNLGNALNSLGREDEAVKQYEAALRLMPDNATIHIDLAIALLKAPARVGEAVLHLREAIRLQPDNPLPRQILARVGSAGD